MSIFIVKSGKKTLPGSIYVKILIFLWLIAISAFIMKPVQYALNKEMIKIKVGFFAKLEDITGFTVRYSSIRPSIFGSFNIDNLGLFKEEKAFFSVSQVKIHYSIMELLLHRKAFIHTVQIDGPEINIDTANDADTFDFIKTINEKRKSGDEFDFHQITEFLPSNAEYQIRHLNLNLTDKHTSYKIENMNLNIKEHEGEITFFARFYAELKRTGLFDKIIILGADAGISGTCSSDLDKGNAELSIYYLNCSEQDDAKKTASFFKLLSNDGGTQRRLFNMLPFKTYISYNNHVVSVKPQSEDERNNFYFNYNTDSGGIHAGIMLDNFNLESLINFSDYLKNASDLLFVQITGNSSFVYENGFFDYNINFKGGENGASSINKDTFTIDVYGDEKEIIVNDFFMSSINPKKDIFSGSLGISGNLEFAPLVSQGSAYFDGFSLTGTEKINAEFIISSHDKGILISSDEVKIAQTAINDFSIFLLPTEKEIGFNVSGFFIEGGSVYLDAVYNGSPGEIEASAALDSLSLFSITEVFRPFSENLSVPSVIRGIFKDSSIKTDIFFSTDFNNIVYNAPSIAFYIGKTNGLLSLSGTGRQITLSEGIIFQNEQDENEIKFSSNINFSNIMDLTFSFNAGFHDLAWNIEGQILDRTTLIIRDQNGFHGYGTISNNGALSGFIEGVNYPILLNSQTIYLNFYLSLRYDSYDFWRLNMDNFSARYASSNDGSDFFKISGLADQNGASFREILYTDEIGMLLGNADFFWDADFSYCSFNLNITDGHESGEYYYADGKLKKDNMNVNISVSEMHVNRFLKINYPVIASADASISWNSLDSFLAKINLSSLRTRINGSAVYAEVNVNFSNDELFVHNLRLDYAQLKTNLSELKFNITEGAANAKADISGAVLEKKVEGNIEFNADFIKINSWFDLNNILKNINGKLSFENFTYGNINDEEFIIEYSVNNGAVSVKGGPRDMIRLEMDSDGMFFLGLSAPMFIRGNVVGTYKNGIVDAKTNYFFIDLPTLFNIFSAQNDFLITGGYITGKAGFTGPFWNPEFHGTARAESLRFKAPNFVVEDIRVAPVDVIAEGYEMTFGPIAVLSGNGSGTANGWFNFENWAPANIGIDVSIPRETPIPYGINVVGFLAKGNGSGKLNLNISLNNKLMEIKGDLFTNESDLSLNMEELTANMEKENVEADFNTVVDLKLTAGSMVEFIWPSTNPIIRANPEMGTVIYVTADSQTHQYSLNGNIKIRSGELYYFDRSFFIRQGSMVLKENESKFEPRISARAEIRDRSDSGPVTITMIIENQPLFSFEPRFEASPGMTQLEIYSILGQNFNSIQGDENPELAQRFLWGSTADLATQFFASWDVFSQLVFLRQSERLVRNFLKLDVFSVRTRLIQNMFVTGAMGLGGLGQNTGQDYTDRSNKVGNYFDNTTVYIGKYIGKDMFFQGMVTMKYDENNNVFGGLRLEPDIGIELQSPFINIRWDFSPDFYHYRPENWMIGNSITLSWSKSF
ncbi:hypothetical protein R84B8_01076 [Treponema sp. R8-4-B8]